MRRLDTPDAEHAAINVCLGEPQRSESPLIQQHEPFMARLRSLFFLAQRNRATDVSAALSPVDVFSPKRERL